MPHFICRWPCGDVLLASVDSREDLDAILQERSEPGVCKVARYHGPLVLELKPLVPLVFRGSSAAFRLDPPRPAFAPVWGARAGGGDVRVVAADGAAEPAHRVVLQCRVPALAKADWGPRQDEVRIEALPDGPTLTSFLEFLYTDDLPPDRLTHALHVAALRCHVPRLAALCERRFAAQLEEQMGSWPALSPAQQAAALDSLLEWARYAEALSRGQLLDLVVHLAAQRLPAARTRPSWSALSPRTQRLVELAAVATSPPLVHRSLEADGAAGPQQLAAMSIEAESYAQAGGRMTQAEWQALNKYRAAVAEAQVCPEASPLTVSPSQLRECGLAAADQQRFPFEVKAPTLAPFKRLMDSVCRFAFPSVHGALGALKQERERAAAAGRADVLPDGDAEGAGGGGEGGVDEAFVGATEGITLAVSGRGGGAAADGAAAAAEAAARVPPELRGVPRDALELVLLGTVSAQPSSYRNVSSYYLDFFGRGGALADCGEDAMGQLERRYGAADAQRRICGLRFVWVSHMHADHHSGLYPLLARRAAAGAPPLLVIGPMPLWRVLQEYAKVVPMRYVFMPSMYLHEAAAAAASGAPPPRAPPQHALDMHAAAARALGLSVLEPFPVKHVSLSTGLRLSGAAPGRQSAPWTVVFSGDTRPCPAVVDAARGATLLIHEATFEDELASDAEAKRHSTLSEALRVASDAGVYRTVLTHFSGRYPRIPVLAGQQQGQGQQQQQQQDDSGGGVGSGGAKTGDGGDKPLTSMVGDSVAVGFDFMTVNLADLPWLPLVVPACDELLREEGFVGEGDDELDDDGGPV